jgi:hypothetical protein
MKDMDENPYQSPDAPPTPQVSPPIRRSSLLSTLTWLVLIFALPVVTAIWVIDYICSRILLTHH